MSVLNKIAYFQGQRDEGPNQELARELEAHIPDWLADWPEWMPEERLGLYE